MIRFEGNQLFLGNEEIREYGGTHRDSVPAHDKKIQCVGSSPRGTRIITIDEGGRIKIWDPSRPNLDKRIWYGNLSGEITALGVTANSNRIASATGLNVTIYDVKEIDKLMVLKVVPLSKMTQRIVNLSFTDEDNVVCCDAGGNSCIVSRDPAWKAT